MLTSSVCIGNSSNSVFKFNQKSHISKSNVENSQLTFGMVFRGQFNKAKQISIKPNGYEAKLNKIRKLNDKLVLWVKVTRSSMIEYVIRAKGFFKKPIIEGSSSPSNFLSWLVDLDTTKIKAS